MTLDLPWRVVRRGEAGVSTWGDDISGKVDDLVYGRHDPTGLYLCHSTLKSGRHFTLSDQCWPVSEGWNAIHVLRGCFMAYDPFAEVAIAVEAGATLFVPPRVWHFGQAISETDVEMLEFIGPSTPGPQRSMLERPSVPNDWQSSLRSRHVRRLVNGMQEAISGDVAASPIVVSTLSGGAKLPGGTWCFAEYGSANLQSSGSFETLSACDAAFIGATLDCQLSVQPEGRVICATIKPQSS